ncbi:NB-ARC domain-containing protein [Nonomuraea sp. NPDC048892]|uniref:ATP-binding protein n=1 Tax=Nonomuraea sp. NPDC048892 TaxID=3154624 RepID=UPI003405BDF7
MSLGELLRTWRRRALLTQEQLAERAGLNVRTVRRLENDGLLRPRTTSVLLLARALDLDEAERAALNTAARSTTGAPVAGGADTGRPVVADPRPWTVPRQLPADVAAPGVRECEAAFVAARTTQPVVFVTGMAGTGKTVLAVHAAHRLAPLFPDGQLFVDLHGHAQGAAPVEPGDALARVLRTLGVPAEHVPWHLDDRAALYRSVLADRRLLIVLDDAAGEHQLHPLLPATPGCRVIVTSRHRLTCPGDARILSLDTLPLTEAVALFVRTAGYDLDVTTGRAPDVTSGGGADAPPDVLAEIVRRCGLLPLAIRLAAARLQAHPSWNACHLLDRLTTDRLAELAAGHQSVTGALNRSYERLPPDQRRTYRLLGSAPHPSFTLGTAAALLNTTTDRASRLLDPLLDAHLLQEPAPGRYRLHDLVHAHASTLRPPHGVRPSVRVRCRTASLT